MNQNEIIKMLEGETALMAYLDLTNMFHWQKKLGWKFRMEDVITQLYDITSLKEVKVYYGLDERNKINSQIFHERIRSSGGILRTKPVKYIRKTITQDFFFQRATLTRFDNVLTEKVKILADEVQRSGIIIEEAKCNFDVEITIDLLDDIDKVSGVILFSGDGDFMAPLERYRIKGKNVFIVSVRGMTARELFRVSDKFINFGNFYGGKKTYPQSENPDHRSGPHI